MDEKCENCKYFTDDALPSSGHCHYYPVKQDLGYQTPYFPTTMKIWWCGKYTVDF